MCSSGLLTIENLGPLFQDFINEFSGVAHRLEFVLSTNGLSIYNDAKSTNSQATVTAIKAFQDLQARALVPMHYGSFRLSFEEMDEPPRWLRQIAQESGLTSKICILEEGAPEVF